MKMKSDLIHIKNVANICSLESINGREREGGGIYPCPPLPLPTSLPLHICVKSSNKSDSSSCATGAGGAVISVCNDGLSMKYGLGWVGFAARGAWTCQNWGKKEETKVFFFCLQKAMSGKDW